MGSKSYTYLACYNGWIGCVGALSKEDAYIALKNYFPFCVKTLEETIFDIEFSQTQTRYDKPTNGRPCKEMHGDPVWIAYPSPDQEFPPELWLFFAESFEELKKSLKDNSGGTTYQYGQTKIAGLGFAGYWFELGMSDLHVNKKNEN